MTASTDFRYGVPQEQDWNALTDDAFRALVREDFETHYPVAQRFPPRRLRWSENKDWYLRLAAKGWIAPAWPVEYGGMGFGTIITSFLFLAAIAAIVVYNVIVVALAILSILLLRRLFQKQLVEVSAAQ